MVKDFLLAALPWVCIALVLAVFFSRFAAKKKRRDARLAAQDAPAADGGEKPADKEDGENYMSEGMSLGMCIGLAIGTSIDQLALGISLGMLLGMCVGMTIKKEK